MIVYWPELLTNLLTPVETSLKRLWVMYSSIPPPQPNPFIFDLLMLSFIRSACVASCATGAFWVAYKLLNIGKRDKSLPPGPPTLPLLGNIPHYPAKMAHLK